MNHFSEENAPQEYEEHRTVQGRIERVISPAESDLGYWCVDVSAGNSGRFKDVPYTGWIQFDPETQEPHGLWIPPKKLNSVILTFLDGRPDAPAMICASPTALRNTGPLNYEQLKKLHSSKLLGDQVGLFHYKGYKLYFDESGLTIKKGGKILTIKDSGIFAGAEGATPDKVISYTKLSEFLQTVVGNLGGPLFPSGLPESVTFTDFFGGI